MDSTHHSPPEATAPLQRPPRTEQPTAETSSEGISAGETTPPPPIDTTIERRILRKLDFTFLPMLNVLFIVSFADRSNIGNAKIAGMSRDLELTGNRYNIAVMVFTIAYMIFGIPASVAFKAVGPRSLSYMMFIWGLFAMGQGFVRGWGGLVACRFMMGVFEAGFVPGCAYLIGSYYKDGEFLRRYAFFMSGAIIAGAVNGLFSYLLSKADGAGGIAGWRWIFILEGILTCLLALLAYFFILAFPHDTKMFTSKEKEVLLQRLGPQEEETDINIRKEILTALSDWKIWLATLVYMGVQENASSVVAFLPSILKGLGYSSVQAQVHSIPIYCVAFVLTLTCAYAAERLKQRYALALFGGLLTLTGLAIQLAHHSSNEIRYMGTFFMASGCYIVMPIMVVWNAINMGKGYKRVVAFAMTTAVGNCGVLFSSNVYLSEEEPGYRTGFSVGTAFSCLSIVSMTVLYVGLRVANKRKSRGALEVEAGGVGEGEKGLKLYQL